jgi:hypothetical protein
MNEVSVTIDVQYVDGTEICDGCSKPIEDLKSLVLELWNKSLRFHESCLEQLSWKLVYFIFNYKIDQLVPESIN